MMQVYKCFKLFGLYFYISSIRMKRRRPIDEKMRNQRKVLHKRKMLLYRKNGGCCEFCGKPFAPSALEIHHIIGVTENPGLALVASNMALLCHECHAEVHRKPSPPHASEQEQSSSRECGS